MASLLARSLAHGHCLVNGHHCDIPKAMLAWARPATRSRSSRAKHSQKLVKLNQQVHPAPIPDFLEITSSEPGQPKVGLTLAPPAPMSIRV